jgi:hypothetical protein
MSFVVTVSAALTGSAVRLGQGTPRQLNDDIVRPGWIGFGVFIALAVASYFLFRSMNRHLKKVNFEEEPLDGPVTDETAPKGDGTPSD